MYLRNYGPRKAWLHKCAEKSRLRGRLDKQHCKRAKTLIQSKQQHLYHIH